MKSTKHLKILIFIVIVGGALGGLGNYLMSPAPTENVNGIVKPIILGIISAAVLPVFLKLVSSSVLDFVDESLQLKNYIYFMSFCLLSALFSEVF
ncbi:MAG: YEATS-associated helix-containing protein [Flavobacteriaceae bacterium]